MGTTNIYSLERDPWFKSEEEVIGLDEVGRGCLAGPVVSAGVLFPAYTKFTDSQKSILDSINDSKKLSPTKRKILSEKIRDLFQFSITFIEAAEIDRINILQASLKAMGECVSSIGGHRLLLVDGHMKIPKKYLSSEPPQIPVVKGDLFCKAIGAASIIAKVARDEWMEQMDQRYPQYAFSIHKGYPTPLHKERLSEFGPSEIHRRSFQGVLQQGTLV